MKFNPSTPLYYYAGESAYVPGTGATKTWTKIIPDALYAEWRGGYGDRAIAAESLGVSDMATVRTFFHPDVYEKMNRKQVVVVKNSDNGALKNGLPEKNNPNVYELWGGVDNVANENQFMEFRVRRYEPK
jgi:hypothetical protein